MNTSLKIVLGLGLLAICLYATSPQHEAEFLKQNQIKEKSNNLITPSLLNEVELKVALDAEKQYEIVKRNNGSQIDLNVRAALVAEAYLQMHDEVNYNKWKQIAETHAKP